MRRPLSAAGSARFLTEAAVDANNHAGSLPAIASSKKASQAPDAIDYVLFTLLHIPRYKKRISELSQGVLSTPAGAASNHKSETSARIYGNAAISTSTCERNGPLTLTLSTTPHIGRILEWQFSANSHAPIISLPFPQGPTDKPFSGASSD